MASKENPSTALDDLMAGIIRPKVNPEVLLAEIEDLVRNRPTPDDFLYGLDDALAWLGRAGATLSHWDSPRGGAILIVAETDLHSKNMAQIGRGYGRLIALLNEARHSVRMESAQSMNVAVEKGAVFDYFDGLRKIVERATSELFFVDPYLDADFVARYLPFVHPGVSVRLLGRQNKWLGTLLPAVDAYAKQKGANITVRSTDHHDRFVFVDGKECYQSGASFKDGGKAPTALTQITDAFAAMSQTYEGMWAAAKVER